MTDSIDFSQCERLPSRAYNGANGKKITACYEALFVQQKVGDHPYFGSAVPTEHAVTEEIDALRHGRFDDL